MIQSSNFFVLHGVQPKTFKNNNLLGLSEISVYINPLAQPTFRVKKKDRNTPTFIRPQKREKEKILYWHNLA